MKTPSFWKKSLYSALIFFGVLIVLSVGYGALTGGLSTADKVGSGSGLTSASWNRIVDGVLDLDTRVSNFSFSGGNVGVGTASPAFKIDIDNAMRIKKSSWSGRIEMLGGSDGSSASSIYMYNPSNQLSTTLSDGTYNSFLNAYGGNVGIGTASPSATLEVKRDAATGVPALFNDPNTDGVGRGIINFSRNGSLVGQIATTNTATTYNSISDRRLKKGFEPVRDALAQVNQIEVRKFRFKTQSENDPKTTGFIAQQLRPIAPYAVTGTENEKDEKGNIKFMSVDYGKLTPLLAAAIQELKKENDAVKTRNNELEKRLEAVEKELIKEKQ